MVRITFWPRPPPHTSLLHPISSWNLPDVVHIGEERASKLETTSKKHFSRKDAHIKLFARPLEARLDKICSIYSHLLLPPRILTVENKYDRLQAKFCSFLSSWSFSLLFSVIQSHRHTPRENVSQICNLLHASYRVPRQKRSINKSSFTLSHKQNSNKFYWANRSEREVNRKLFIRFHISS